jgi:hypothetical protein
MTISPGSLNGLSMIKTKIPSSYRDEGTLRGTTLIALPNGKTSQSTVTGADRRRLCGPKPIRRRCSQASSTFIALPEGADNGLSPG